MKPGPSAVLRLDPSQIIDERTPEQQLWAAVIEATIEDLAGEAKGIRPQERGKWRRDAMRWITSANFEAICAELDLEPDTVRRALGR